MRTAELEALLPSTYERMRADALGRMTEFNDALSRCLSSGNGPSVLEVRALLEDAANRYLDLGCDLLSAYPSYPPQGTGKL